MLLRDSDGGLIYAYSQMSQIGGIIAVVSLNFMVFFYLLYDENPYLCAIYRAQTVGYVFLLASCLIGHNKTMYTYAKVAGDPP